MIYDVTFRFPLQGPGWDHFTGDWNCLLHFVLGGLGVHGQSVVNGVTALLLSNLDANKSMLAAGSCPLKMNCSHCNATILDSFLILSGSGITFGFGYCYAFAAKIK